MDSKVYHYDLSFFYDATSTGSLSFLYANIRSVRKNFNNLLAEISQIKNEIDFFILSEIWINNDELNLYKLPGYNSFANCNNSYRGGVYCVLREGNYKYNADQP